MMVLVAVVIVAAAAAIFLIPGVLESIAMVLIVIAVAVAIIVAIIWICMIVLAIPMYAAKGETYQTDISYDLDDVESVKETSSDDKDAH